MRFINLLKIFSGFILLCLAGCFGSSKENTVNEYVLKIKSRKSQPIDPLPEVKLFTPFTYSATDMRSPFKRPIIEVAAAAPGVTDSSPGLHPDANRPKEPLEAFSLDNLKMVGTLENEEGTWALIKDQSGTVHRVKVGDYLGQNFGKIDEIKEEAIKLTELVQDPQGIWRERQVALTLTE